MKKFLLLTLIFILVMFLIKPWDWQIHVRNSHKTLAQMLELNSRQVEYEKLLKEENRRQVRPVLLEIEKTTKEYKQLIINKADSAVLVAEKKKIDRLHEKYNKIQRDHMEKFEKILTVDQNKKFKIIKTQLFLKD
jgi:hypothetical protein